MYEPPTRSDLIEATALFKRTLTATLPDPELSAGWQSLGFDLVEIPQENETLWLLCEPTTPPQGQGWYLFRTNQQASIALQAPHARNDAQTGVIGLRLFLSGQVRLLAASTITRHQADAAHLNDTFFHASTVAFADTCPTGLVLQLHGFASEKHPLVDTDMIMSEGTRTPSPRLPALAARLHRDTPFTVAIYPNDIRELGGTQNAQARALRDRSCQFVHLEMSRELRERLVNDTGLIDRVLNSFLPISSP